MNVFMNLLWGGFLMAMAIVCGISAIVFLVAAVRGLLSQKDGKRSLANSALFVVVIAAISLSCWIGSQHFIPQCINCGEKGFTAVCNACGETREGYCIACGTVLVSGKCYGCGTSLFVAN